MDKNNVHCLPFISFHYCPTEPALVFRIRSQLGGPFLLSVTSSFAYFESEDFETAPWALSEPLAFPIDYSVSKSALGSSIVSGPAPVSATKFSTRAFESLSMSHPIDMIRQASLYNHNSPLFLSSSYLSFRSSWFGFFQA